MYDGKPVRAIIKGEGRAAFRAAGIATAWWAERRRVCPLPPGVIVRVEWRDAYGPGVVAVDRNLTGHQHYRNP